MKRFAVVSDIHANLPALEAVLSDIAARGISHILCLGDLIGKGPSPAQVVDRVRETCDTVIRGNWDEAVTMNRGTPMWDFYRERLGESRLQYLGGLPFAIDLSMSGRKIRLFHASAISVHHRVQPWSSEEERLGMFTHTTATGGRAGDPAPDVVGYGDIHNVFLQHLSGHTLFNVGSVGNPLDITQASYAILEGESGATENGPFAIQFVRVPYDIERAIADAQAVDMPQLKEYASELRTARYRGLKN
ncbi:MAG: metallophosphoesterase family protein [Firmicutes bacterium]|nr:metallophosphoesterase family protein [Bacillota bacterium]